MDQSQEPASPVPRPAGGAWTAEERGAAFRAYYSTGSRRKARMQTGVPERTLSVWLRDERYEDERRAVQAGLISAAEQEAAERGAELAEATREAILVCRKALRQAPDGKTASSLLSALTRARESEDRIRRLDHGDATEIHGIKLSDEDRASFHEWLADREAMARRSDAELKESMHELLVTSIRTDIANRDAGHLRGILALLVSDGTALRLALIGDVALARSLQDTLTAVLQPAPESLPEPAPAPATGIARLLGKGTWP